MKTENQQTPMKYLAWVAAVLLLIQACKMYPQYFRANYRDANTLLHTTENLQTKPFLKAHLKNGDICILQDTWQIDTIRHLVSGKGSRYDYNRKLAYEGDLVVAIDSVAIFETNEKLGETEAKRIAALSILTGVDLILGIICLTVPKACFGSCPTFYLDEADHFHYADAEGFSNAIAPSLEYPDIDALDNPVVTDGNFTLTMKNEALETHCVNELQLLAYPRAAGERVYQSPDDDFYRCTSPYPLRKAIGPEGEVTDLLATADRQERFSLADERNLRSKETIYLEFDPLPDDQELGLLIHFRQSLMTTYFIYSAMGYMGDEVGDIFAQVERDPATNEKLKKGIKQELGNIEVYLWAADEQAWKLQHECYETGPIAINKQLLPLSTMDNDGRVRLKLVMNKGLWRIDYLALAPIQQQVTPLVLHPTTVLNKGKVDPDALAQLTADTDYLIAMPGSEYTFRFQLPKKEQDYELFLRSKGYYLEWMRAHWLAEKDLLKLRQMIENPRKYLKAEAAAYKSYEMDMEAEFWNSKIDTENFTYYDD